VDVFEVKDVVTSVALATVYHVVYCVFLRFVRDQRKVFRHSS
jgi:hypothetical protein